MAKSIAGSSEPRGGVDFHAPSRERRRLFAETGSTFLLVRGRRGRHRRVLLTEIFGRPQHSAQRRLALI
jgi:hypothetical protein